MGIQQERRCAEGTSRPFCVHTSGEPAGLCHAPSETPSCCCVVMPQHPVGVALRPCRRLDPVEIQAAAAHPAHGLHAGRLCFLVGALETCLRTTTRVPVPEIARVF